MAEEWLVLRKVPTGGIERLPLAGSEKEQASNRDGRHEACHRR
jgi:hypothetical protein